MRKLWVCVAVAAVVGLGVYLVSSWDEIEAYLKTPAPTWLVIVAALYVVSRNSENTEELSRVEAARAAHQIDAEAEREVARHEREMAEIRREIGSAVRASAATSLALVEEWGRAR